MLSNRHIFQLTLSAIFGSCDLVALVESDSLRRRVLKVPSSETLQAVGDAERRAPTFGSSEDGNEGN